LETFRCPTCLFVLTDPGQKRCPSCHKRLRRRGQPIVLGDKSNFGSHEPTINLVLAERADRLGAPPDRVGASVAAPIDAHFVDMPPDLPTVDLPAADVAPVEMAPVDITPVDITPVDITPVDIAMFVSPPSPPGPPPAVTSSSVLVPPAFTTRTSSWPPPIAPVVDDPVVAPIAVATEHTTIFEPSQFDPEMRQVLDDLYRKARSAPDD
jgi:hypothetical protein